MRKLIFVFIVIIIITICSISCKYGFNEMNNANEYSNNTTKYTNQITNDSMAINVTNNTPNTINTMNIINATNTTNTVNTTNTTSSTNNENENKTNNNEELLDEEYKVMYCAHIQDIGWQEWKQNGELAGTTGQSKRLEAIKLNIENLPKNANIQYQVHVQDIGWQEWKQNGELVGTTGQSKRLEAIKIKLVNMPEYTVEYRTHIQDIGWQDWKQNGDQAGTTGESKRLEGIEIKIVKKEIFLTYKAHVQDIGWMNYVYDNETCGTTGKSLRMEALSINVHNLPEGVRIKFIAHVQDIGWQNWKTNGETIGTTGQSKRLEAIKIKLENTEKYSVAYRAHVEDIGWQDWVYDGEIAGTTGISRRVEAIQIRIIDKIKEKRKIATENGIYGASGLKVEGDRNGADLKYYKIGSGPNVFFATFAIHGWEDDFDFDGQELTKIANGFKERLISMNDIDLANKWTIFIFPSVNPDGEYYGWTHNGPGRTTLHSAAPEHKGIDMNRTWGTDWVKYTTDRNYSGTEPFQAYEARSLREFLLSHKSVIGQTILVDLHGWLFETMGDTGVSSYYRSQLGISKHISSYGRGYLINWARANLGSNGKPARSALIELPEAYSSADVSNWGLSYKYINATIKMLNEI